jgi:hypothetical protein
MGPLVKSDNQAIVTVATAASTAAEHVLSFSRTVEVEECCAGKKGMLATDAMGTPQPDQSPSVAGQPLSTSDATPSIAATAADGATAE